MRGFRALQRRGRLAASGVGTGGLTPRAPGGFGMATLAILGDTMLGRGVAEVLERDPSTRLFDPALVEIVRSADLALANLECCISERGDRWPDPRKRFFFRAPPAAAEVLAELGVSCVTLANNHALDYGSPALLDTLEHLKAAGIAWVGAGADEAAARRPHTSTVGELRVRFVGVSDHPAEYAATASRPGIAFADLRSTVDLEPWLLEAATPVEGVDATVVTPHWGPNMQPTPVRHVRAAARELVEAGATLVAGHSAHVIQGVGPPVLYDVGGFVDDYAVDDVLRNDLGLLFLVELDPAVRRIAAMPLRLDFAHTALAEGPDAAWIRETFTSRCAGLGADVQTESGWLVVR